MKKIITSFIKSAVSGFKEAYPHLFPPKNQKEFDAYVESLRRKGGGCKPGGGCCGQRKANGYINDKD